MTRDDGGPAFPATAELVDSAPGSITTRRIADGGMSLRDYFAAQTMLGLLSSAIDLEADLMARTSYLMADVMLKARKE